MHRLEKTKVPSRQANRGDSGGSEHPKNGCGDSSQEKPAVHINVTSVEQIKEE